MRITLTEFGHIPVLRFLESCDACGEEHDEREMVIAVECSLCRRCSRKSGAYAALDMEALARAILSLF
jgi:hypothetical protein